ncbi:MAG: hypothetical protein GY830_10400 [Bacteroidetes bacterium]|nr:hypothetical protein [Bacteroidota bacterium]
MHRYISSGGKRVFKNCVGLIELDLKLRYTFIKAVLHPKATATSIYQSLKSANDFVNLLGLQNLTKIGLEISNYTNKLETYNLAGTGLYRLGKEFYEADIFTKADILGDLTGEFIFLRMVDKGFSMMLEAESRGAMLMAEEMRILEAENAIKKNLPKLKEAYTKLIKEETKILRSEVSVANALEEAEEIRKGAGKVPSKLQKIHKEAREFLGKDYKKITNKSGDNIFMSKDGLKKMRFDIKNPHGDAPHVHLEVFKNGKWQDAIKGSHRLYPKQ